MWPNRLFYITIMRLVATGYIGLTGKFWKNKGRKIWKKLEKSIHVIDIEKNLLILPRF